MSTWEERMSRAAAERAAVAEAVQIAQDAANDPHALHHMHLRGTAVECSCGLFHGITCVAGDFDAKVSCRICGEPDVVALGGDG